VIARVFVSLALSSGSQIALKLGMMSQRVTHAERGNMLITFPGCLPIVDKEGVLTGAIGVSGSSVENDHAVALAGGRPIGVSDLPAHPWRT
jgi:uncharacterized protein GlcG (DUF336 family)